MTENEVYVWKSALDLPSPLIAAFWEILSGDERTRALRFHRELDGNRYIAGRGMLRRLLGDCVGLPPERVRLVIGPNGKPELATECNPDDVRFNLAHSGDIVLYAVTHGRCVGVDVELVRDDIEIMELAAQFFALSELEDLRSLPESQRLHAFYVCWTRKEAYLKGRGDGIPFGLDRFQVSLTPDAPAALLSTSFDPEEKDRWTLHSLNVSPNYAAALAVEGCNHPTILLSEIAAMNP